MSGHLAVTCRALSVAMVAIIILASAPGAALSSEYLNLQSVGAEKSPSDSLPSAPSAGSFVVAAQGGASQVAESDQDELSASLETITVEGERPDWERLLSPGAVNVIVPDDYKGEQKKLPQYLQMVPGLHVEQRGGEGQFATVTMRGSTSAQVNIYVDGV
ncbi:MAG: TonB-dependent receptor plug domain-containing protein, partial [Deltaproteobacteria bacterium]|nr:TonB-dependent receptor plug domain-containing protein [Deltaproteobacteria bacterium]